MILHLISQETGVSIRELAVICATASQRYRNYTIAKRTEGRRTINHPTPELKFLQRWLNKNVFSLLPVHDAAYAYRRGRSVVDNARLHSGNNYLLKIDFVDFFPSLKGVDVDRVVVEHLERMDAVTRNDIDLIRAVVCKDDKLTIGAPSSPILSNAILYDFDMWASTRASQRGVVYSRYADDLFLSTNQADVLSAMLDEIRGELSRRRSPALKINDKKTVFTSSKHRKMVTGIVLTTDGETSVGRRKKREVKTLIHLYSLGKLDPDRVSYLRGYLAFVRSVEKQFIQSLEGKFGKKIMNRIMQENLTDRKA